MTPDELRARTKSFALRVVKLYRSLPRTARTHRSLENSFCDGERRLRRIIGHLAVPGRELSLQHELAL